MFLLREGLFFPQGGIEIDWHQLGGGAGIPHPSDFDPTNTTIFIGGLSPGITEDDLRNVFGRFGEIIYTKVPANKGCGFCQFVERSAAEKAMAQLQGQVRAHSSFSSTRLGSESHVSDTITSDHLTLTHEAL